METYTVYILHSPKYDKYYIGQTENFASRLQLHNAGLVQSTKPYISWEVTLTLSKPSRSEAMILEKKLKNLNRMRLLQFITKYSGENSI
ncbi:MAG: hypothetical protein A3D31_01790 [Candidatus Fluviicola riflensis]|nr:MAG: hypothetical protein CHH17_13245 [Candidatus Fluviicola riflensis]OGS78731.1 MAG: hypothetical protein A3D31_01790 [Candidatus Fluviicola riflensis]OGS86162.1 MAG: hypothetical protein A2724_01245 [Fluviicola sp. RIFCSPHIGHO2_01_FULL_43_53]OGS87693.1 MAG: hypothetical protein A3E30_16455 [Fluviicola sp. RIFCSPHIGHO2_12_FULL_43_24]